MDGIILHKLNQWQIHGSIIFFIVDVAMQIVLKYVINTFGLTISLKMKNKKKFNFYFQDFKDGSLKFREFNT